MIHLDISFLYVTKIFFLDICNLILSIIFNFFISYQFLVNFDGHKYILKWYGEHFRKLKMSYFPFIGQYYSERIFTLLYLCVFFTHIAIFNVKK